MNAVEENYRMLDIGSRSVEGFTNWATVLLDQVPMTRLPTMDLDFISSLSV